MTLTIDAMNVEIADTTRMTAPEEADVVVVVEIAGDQDPVHMTAVVAVALVVADLEVAPVMSHAPHADPALVPAAPRIRMYGK